MVFTPYDPQGPRAAMVGEGSCLKVCEYTASSPLPALPTAQTEITWIEYNNLHPKLHHFLFLVSVWQEKMNTFC